MRKINQKKEKAERNKIYAKKFADSWEQQQEEKKKERKFKSQGGKYGRWCRTKGHPPECDCTYQ